MTMRSHEALLAILTAAVSGEPSEPDLAGDVDWRGLVDLATTHKTQLLLLAGLKAIKLEAPSEVIQYLTQLQQICLHENMKRVAANVRVVRLLKTHGIESLSVKGVLRSQEVYGRPDIRFSVDVDLLVRRRDYRAAGEVLLANGYWAPVPTNSEWWHHYLGESPYIPEGVPAGPTIDLHHKLDQPGTPALSDIDSLFEQSVVRHFGGYEVQTLDPFAALMLTATSFGKALRQHEPCLAYLHDIASARAPGNLRDDELEDYARQHNLLRLWRHARDTADAMFRPSTGKEPTAALQEVVQDLATPTWPQRLLHRTRLLWNWTDGEALRPVRFAREFSRVRAAMASHAAFEKRMRETPA